MKKYLLQSGLIAVMMLCFVSFNAVKAESENIIIGERAEEIDGMLHRVDYLYGSTLYTDIESMLKNLNSEVYPEDKISYFPDPGLGIGSKIIIKRANTIFVNDAGVEKTVRTWKLTVEEVLKENNIALGEKDVIDVGVGTNLNDLAYSKNRKVVEREGRSEAPVIGTINITRVAETEISERENIEFKTITKKDPNLEKGKTEIVSSGKTGIKEKIYLIHRENGNEISRNLIKTNIISESVDKVISEGTKVVSLGAGLATWYDLVDGMTAASNTIPYGTIVHVVNIETGRSVDVKIVDHGIQGGAIIDLSKEAFQKLAPLGKGVVQVRLEKP